MNFHPFWFHTSFGGRPNQGLYIGGFGYFLALYPTSRELFSERYGYAPVKRFMGLTLKCGKMRRLP